MTDEHPISPPPLGRLTSRRSVVVLVLTLAAGIAIGATLSSLAWYLSVHAQREPAGPGLRPAHSAAPEFRTAPEPNPGPVSTPAPAPRRSPEPSPAPQGQGAVLASMLQLGADDFVVDIYLNGQRIPDSDRKVTAEVYGATGERVSVTVKDGDWLVFNVVNNRLRWGGVCYFAAAGITEDGAVAFVSEETEQWSACEDPGQAPRFIADRAFLANQPVRSIDNPWPGGDKMMSKQVPGWSGQAIWGSPTNRNIWLKFTPTTTK